jgi:hypothetical protein
MPPSSATFAGSGSPSVGRVRPTVHCRRSVERDREMAEPVDHLRAAAEIVRGLRDLGLQPVLVGGIDLFYDRGLELGSVSGRHFTPVTLERRH